MNASDLFPPSEYLKSEDIEELGGEMQLTVKGVSRKEYEEEDGYKTVKGLLTFNETNKKLTLNVTNTHTMMTMYGDKDIDRVWLGKTVILFVDPNVKNKGKIVKGIRIRLIDERQDNVTAFWKKSREMGYTQQQGLDHVKQFGGDFKQALDALGNPF
jgi:hypothetical protein